MGYTKIVNIFRSQNLAKKLLFLGLAVFFFVGFLSIGHFGMNMDQDGQMSNCPIMGAETICQMNPLEHLAAWQSIFTVLPSKDTFNIITLLFLSLIIFLSLRSSRCDDNSPPVQSYNLFSRIEALIIRNPLQEAISSGIIHPKSF